MTFKWFRKQCAGFRAFVSDAHYVLIHSFVKTLKDWKNVRRARALLRTFHSKFRDAMSEPGERNPIKNCKHLKGTQSFRTAHRDYNVACHTFVDGRTKVWCMNGCGFVSWRGDENWKQALDMMEQTSNRPSSSERGISREEYEATACVQVVFQDKGIE